MAMLNPGRSRFNGLRCVFFQHQAAVEAASTILCSIDGGNPSSLPVAL